MLRKALGFGEINCDSTWPVTQIHNGKCNDIQNFFIYTLNNKKMNMSFVSHAHAMYNWSLPRTETFVYYDSCSRCVNTRTNKIDNDKSATFSDIG